ncbi:hypothetical protein QM298_10825 [Pseudomonas mendocina]|nr:hypothetical protein [Pseudomonas mendocina]MDV5861401.1 hypothetical protein [Pseudomonas mendocina]
MKIIGGSFGIKGSAYFAGESLVIESAQKAEYRRDAVERVNARVDAERKFGLIGALIGAVVLGALGTMFLGIFGAVIGVAVAIGGSFYSAKKNIAEVSFTDGKTLTLECTARAVNKLVNFGK